ncbi:MAG: hypothetical protein QOG99_876 [Frankiales bacterium]|nr:hypothetical protein [Frankiales bacterium]
MRPGEKDGHDVVVTGGAEHPEPDGEFGAEYWEDRYRRGEPTSLQRPSPSLVDETGGLSPGQALDAGCGSGADSIWLASRGWHVTALDVSATALAHARKTARAAGEDIADRIEWVHADLTDWDPGERRFDLVTSHYVHVPGPAEDLFGRLASWVAPGGTLLVVGHDGHAHPRGSQVFTEQVTAGLPEDQWEVVVAESRTQTVRHLADESVVTLHDAVVHARRKGPSRLGPAAD